MFNEAVVDLVWSCQDGKHEEMIRTVYNLIEHVLPLLTLDTINLFFDRVKKEQRYDEKFIVFLNKFTQIALERQYYMLEETWQRSQEDISEASEYSYNFDNHLIKEEARFIQNIKENIPKDTHSPNC